MGQNAGHVARAFVGAESRHGRLGSWLGQVSLCFRVRLICVKCSAGGNSEKSLAQKENRSTLNNDALLKKTKTWLDLDDEDGEYSFERCPSPLPSFLSCLPFLVSLPPSLLLSTLSEISTHVHIRRFNPSSSYLF